MYKIRVKSRNYENSRWIVWAMFLIEQDAYYFADSLKKLHEGWHIQVAFPKKKEAV